MSLIDATHSAHDRITTILGLGNILCGDDAFGIIAAEKLYGNYEFPACVQVIDGGAQGATLYDVIVSCSSLLVFDTLMSGREPGSLIELHDREIPSWLGMGKISPHQNSFCELLALASLKNELPQRMALIGLEPLTTAFGDRLSRLSRARIDSAIAMGIKILKSWGIQASSAISGKHLLNEEILKSFDI